MPLNETQESQLVNWCTAHGVRATCPMCGRNNWSTGEIIALPSLDGGITLDGTETTAMVQIICDHCRLVMLFDAATLRPSPTEGS